VAVEHLTYPGFKTLAAMLGISLVSVEMDDQGMMPEALDTACRREKIRGVFVMPGQQNPTTGKMSAKRRQGLVEVARRHSLTIIEDCAYDLSTEKTEPPLALLAPERTILIAGVSKYFGAGLRTAYLVADREFHNRLRQAVLNTIWMASPLTVRLTSMLIESGAAQKALADKLAEAKRRNRAAQRVLEGMQYRMRPDGFFIWLSLPEPWTGPQLELAAAERRVSVFCADKFVVGEGLVPNGVRISLTGPDTLDDLVFGLKTLREIVSAPPSLSALL
jgi:DNA-binding transcriptional MocR family regulator